MSTFPVIDIAPFSGSPREKREVARKVDAACRETGFLAVAGHGVPEGVIDAAWKGAKAFFELPLEEKMEINGLEANTPYGYIPFAEEALAKSRGEETPPDLKETINIGPLQRPEALEAEAGAEFSFAPTLWPENPPEWKGACKTYFRALSELGARIMGLFAVALELPEDFFADKISMPASAMRAINYPETAAPPERGQERAGAHSDYGSLTILLPQKGSSGLEIFTPEGRWREVPVITGTFVVNIGDMMAIWTNDRWVSTLHRVKCPDPADGRIERRQSLAFFHLPNWDACIECIPTCLASGEAPKYEPVTCGFYLMSKFKSTVE